MQTNSGSRSIARPDVDDYHVSIQEQQQGPETRTITTNPPSSDLPSALLARCALGDQGAFARLYQETSGKLYGVAMHLLRDSRAEEVMQDAYVRIWHRAADYRPDKGSAMARMASIVRNRALDLLRRPNIESGVDNQDVWEGDTPGPLEITMQRAEANALMRCLEQLESSQRQVMTLAFFHGMAHAELAQRLKQPLGTVKSWIRRGLQRLKGCLES
ncbi:MAG TPA: sigma-70 family RNA polymerase sigma factor [Burkholderiales bacterium]